MRVPVTMALLLLTGFSLAGTANAQCTLPCLGECKQGAAICNSTTVLNARSSRFSCTTDAGFAMLDCDSVALDDRAGCAGLCGQDRKDCLAQAKSDLIDCKTSAKDDVAICMGDVVQTALDDAASCASDNVSCVAACSNPGPQ